MKFRTILLPIAAAAAIILAAPGRVFPQSADTTSADTLFYLKGVTVNPIGAAGRNSPVTFSEIGEEELRSRYTTQDLPALISELPSATFYSENGNGIGYNYLTLRGFDQRRISVTVNGVPQNDPEDHNVYWIDFPDLASSLSGIHVQRGAGSAFYGPAAIGGSVNLEANPFRLEPGISAEALFGFQEFGGTGAQARTVLNTRKYSVALNSGPVAGQYLFYGRLSTIRSAGYRDNAWVEMPSFFLGAVRNDPTMTTQVNVYGGPIADGLAYFGIPKFAGDDPDLRLENLSYWETDSAGGSYTVKVPRRPQEMENFSQPHFEILHEWRPSEGTTVSNTFFYVRGEGFFDYDASWADTSMLRIGYDYGIPTDVNPADAIVRATVDNRQAGWLPRVNLHSGDQDVTVGAEARFHRSAHYGTLSYAADLPAGYDPDYRFYSYEGARDIVSVYVHDVVRLDERVSLMGEFQVAWNRYGIDDEKYLGNAFSVNWFSVNPRAGVSVDLDGGWNGWFSAAYTTREPRMRNLYAAEDSWFGATPQFEADTAGGTVVYNFDAPLARPEHLQDLEAGAGYTGEALSLRANLFWMEFTDELVKSGQVDIFGQPVTGNAERSRHVGAEIEASSRCGPLLLAGNVTVSSNRLVHHTVLDDAGNAVSLDGNPVAGFPDFLANFRAECTTGPATITVDAKYVGPFYTDNTKNDRRRNDDFYVFNAALVVRPGGVLSALTFRAEARNIFDLLYFQSGEGDAFFPAAERNYLLGVKADL